MNNPIYSIFKIIIFISIFITLTDADDDNDDILADF